MTDQTPRGRAFPEVNHRGWRDFETLRRQATNAVTGLTFGLDLIHRNAEERLAEGDERTFGEVFAAMIPSADRFNFRPGDAQSEVGRSEEALAQMAVPFAVSLCNEYLIDVVELFDDFRATTPPRAASSMLLGELAAHLRDVHGVAVRGRQGELFDILAHLRNRIVHQGGRAGEHLVRLYRGLSGNATQAWERVSGRPFPTPVAGEVVPLGRGEAIAALATADHYASELNRAMQKEFSNRFWAELAIRDWRDRYPKPWLHPDRRLDSVFGYVQREYRVLGLSRHDIADALAQVS